VLVLRDLLLGLSYFLNTIKMIISPARMPTPNSSSTSQPKESPIGLAFVYSLNVRFNEGGFEDRWS